MAVTRANGHWAHIDLIRIGRCRSRPVGLAFRLLWRMATYRRVKGDEARIAPGEFLTTTEPAGRRELLATHESNLRSLGKLPGQ